MKPVSNSLYRGQRTWPCVLRCLPPSKATHAYVPPDQNSARIFLSQPSWQSAFLHCCIDSSEWRDVAMTTHSSRQVHTVDISYQSSLEFVCRSNTSNNSQWLKQDSGGNFKLDGGARGRVVSIDEGGQMKLRDAKGKAVAIVSDLDGTMVGDDEGTRAFSNYWMSSHVTRGSVLIYNTGRDIDSFKELLREKRGVMLTPDAVICSVGTKVYVKGRVGDEWEEDQEWAGRISEGWDLSIVREAAYKALSKVGKDSMHFRPANEQNDFKVTVGVNVKSLPSVIDIIQEAIKDKVQANLIYSGNGDWRYLDLLPVKAGKKQAMEALARQFGFELDSVVACGDSGNDIQMMEGANKGLIVGNAQKELLDFYQRDGSSGGRLHLASKSHAFGIIEGIHHFGFS